MKVDIRVNGESLELKQGASVELELNNPAVSYDQVLGSRATNLPIINSQRNRQILGVSTDPRYRSAELSLGAHVYAGGDLIDWGSIYLRDLSGGLDMDYTSLLSEFFGPLQKLKLSGITALGTLSIPSTWNATLSHTWELGGYALPTIHDPAFYKEKPVGWDEKLNSFGGAYVVGSPKVPCFFLKYVLQRVGEFSGVKFTGDFWNDSGSLLIFNTQVAGQEEITIRDHLPDLSIAELLISLRKAFNLFLGFNSKTKVLSLNYADTLRRAGSTQDWSDRFPRLKGGGGRKPGSILMEFSSNSADAAFSDAFFSPYQRDYFPGESLKITNNMIPLLMKGGVAYCEVGQREAGKEMKALRLLNYQGNPLAASNVFQGTVMNLEGLFEKYYEITGQIETDGYVIQSPAALTAVDVSWISACFSGSGQAAIVHAQGVNWEIIQVLVGFGKSRISSIKMRRLV